MSDLLSQLIQNNPELRQYSDLPVVVDPNLEKYGWAGGVDYHNPNSIKVTQSDYNNPWVLAHEMGHVASQQRYKDYIRMAPDAPRDPETLRLLGFYNALQMEKEADLKAARYLNNAGYDVNDFIPALPGRPGQTEEERQKWFKDAFDKMGLKKGKQKYGK